MQGELPRRRLPERVGPLLEDFKDGLTSALGDELAGVYIYGGLTFADSADTAADIDYHVLLRRRLNEPQRDATQRLHERLDNDHELGRELDGYYLLVDDARGATPPSDQLRPGIRDHPWALHRAHILAGHVITLVGPDPSTIYRPPSWEELDAALQWELSFVRDRLDESPAYCVLNLCRLIYSYDTREVVVSKQASGQWARHELPAQWRSLIDSALRVYAGTATASDLQWLRAHTNSFSSFAEERIIAAHDRRGLELPRLGGH